VLYKNRNRVESKGNCLDDGAFDCFRFRPHVLVFIRKGFRISDFIFTYFEFVVFCCSEIKDYTYWDSLI
jgi:hypothetical protein